MCAAAATKAAENLGSARVSRLRASPARTDGVLAIADFLNAQHLPRLANTLKHFRRDSPSTALRTGCTNTRDACVHQSSRPQKQGTRELPREFPITAFLFTRSNLCQLVTASAEDAGSAAAGAWDGVV